MLELHDSNATAVAAAAANTTPGFTSAPSGGYDDHGEASDGRHSDDAVMLNAPAITGLHLLVAALIISSNSLVVVVIARGRSFREIKYYFVGSLAAADIVIGVNYLLHVAFRQYLFTIGDDATRMIVCRLSLSFATLAGATSIFNLLLLTLDQYFKISRPFAYQRLVTERKAKLACACAWLASLAMMVTSLAIVVTPKRCDVTVIPRAFTVFKYMLLVGIAVAMAITYVKIFSIIRRHLRQIAAQALPSAAVSSATPPPPHEDRPQQRPLVNYRKETRTAVTFSVIIGLYVISWVPYFTVQLYYAGHPESYDFLSMNVLAILCSIDAIVNPFIYAYRMKEFRHEYKKLLCGTFASDMDELNDSNSVPRIDTHAQSSRSRHTAEREPKPEARDTKRKTKSPTTTQAGDMKIEEI